LVIARRGMKKTAMNRRCMRVRLAGSAKGMKLALHILTNQRGAVEFY